MTESFRRREADGLTATRTLTIQLDDGRRLLMLKPNFGRGLRMGPAVDPVDPRAGDEGPGLRPPERLSGGPGGFAAPGGLGGGGIAGGPPGGVAEFWPWPGSPRDWPPGAGLVLMLMLQFLAVAAGAYPVVRSLTRRLERLKQGVEAFGAGALNRRVVVSGRDEVATLAQSFNQAAERIETLVHSNQSLLANASHELRSPLARLKMAVAMLDDAGPGQRAALSHEIHTNIAELDALVEEVLLSSRLEAGAAVEQGDPVDLLGLLAEEASRQGAEASGPEVTVRGSERLLRRAMRNLLENARRYGGDEVSAEIVAPSAGNVQIRVCDRGPGVPEAERERIFEPFYRMSGHAEREGGVGLGLSLVRQIVGRHQGTVHCEARSGGGSCFVISLPVSPPVPAGGAEPRP
jgi:signal transduction histidine kinase